MPATSIGNPHSLQTTNLDWFVQLSLVCRGEGLCWHPSRRAWQRHGFTCNVCGALSGN